jgi:hypothetical protein
MTNYYYYYPRMFWCDGLVQVKTNGVTFNSLLLFSVCQSS